MSKKITIPLNNIRWQLHDLFHEYLDEIYSYRKMSRGCSHMHMTGYDWADDDEVMWLMQQGVIFPGMEDDMANFYDGDDDDEEHFHYENREEVLDGECIWPPKEDTSKKKGKKKKSLDPYGDYWNMIDALEGKKKNKHRRGGKKKYAKVIDITTPYSGDEEDPTEYGGYDDLDASGVIDGKEIWYYPDYHNKSDRLEFNTLSGFSDFCAEQGYHVPRDVGMDIAYRRISHTCLDPELRENGIFQIIAEESYGDMRYKVCPVQELSQ